MAKLCKLSSDVRNLIRSGPVLPGIVRCVEELIYNAIDAGATRITATVNLDSFNIQVEDNGCGIEKEDLKSVGERYHTSKARCKSDLNNLQTYGFRGESLASLIDCSTAVEIITKTNYESSGYSKKFKNGLAGQVKRVVECKISTIGCVINVKGLLNRCRVRQNRIDKALETQELVLMVEHLMLINPKLAITLRDDRTAGALVEAKPLRTMAETLGRMYKQRNGVKHHENFLQSHSFKDAIEIDGIVSKDSHHNSNMQFVFVNKRFIHKSRIYKMLEDQLSSILGFTLRPSTSSKDSQDFLDPRRGKKKSPKAGPSCGETHPVFLVTITCPWTDCNLIAEDKRFKVTFQNMEGLTLAVQAFTSTIRRIVESSHKLAVHSRVGAALKRNNSSDRRERSSTKEETITARKVGERLTLHSMKGPVHSNVAVRLRKPEDHERSARTRDVDSEADSSYHNDDESDESPQQRHARGPTKVMLPEKRKPTSRLQKTFTHNIRGLKKRKQSRDSSAQECQLEVSKKKARLALKSQHQHPVSRKLSNESKYQQSVFSSSLGEEDETVFIGFQSDESQDGTRLDRQTAVSEVDVDVCDRMSVLSVSTRSHYATSAPKTDPKKRFSDRIQDLKPEPEFAYAIVLPKISALNKKLSIPNYAENISLDLTNRFHANSRGNDFSREFQRNLETLRSESVTQDINRTQTNQYFCKKPTHKNELTFPEIPIRGANFADNTNEVHSREVDGFQASNYFGNVGPRKPPHMLSASHRRDDEAHVAFPLDANRNSSSHDNNVLQSQDTSVRFRPKSGKSGNSSNKSEKRFGRVFNSQEFPLGIVDSPFGEIQGAFQSVKREPESESFGFCDRRDSRLKYWLDNVQPIPEPAQTPSDILAQRRQYHDNPRESTFRRKSIDGRSECTRTSSTEEHSQNVVSFSQRFPEFSLANHTREPTNIPDIPDYAYGGILEEYRPRNTCYYPSSGFRERENTGDIQMDNVLPEVMRRQSTSSQYSFGANMFEKSSVESLLNNEASKYFYRTSSEISLKPSNTEPNNEQDVYNRTGSVLMTPVAEHRLPETITSPTSDGKIINFNLIDTNVSAVAEVPITSRLSDLPEIEEIQHSLEATPVISDTNGVLASEGGKMIELNSTENNGEEEEIRKSETVLLRNSFSPTFRNAWLRKVFPEGAKTYWKQNEVVKPKVKSSGGIDPMLAETVRFCFSEACDDDLIMDKWDAQCWMAANAAPFVNQEDLKSKEFGEELPLESSSFREVQFWNKKNNEDLQVTCRFTRDDLTRAIVIGQVDRKFIASNVPINQGDGTNGNRMLVLFDQHAVHERIRLEKLIFESQEEAEGVRRLVFANMCPPKLLNFSDAEVRIMNSYKTSFVTIGITLEVCGPYTVKVLTVPTCFVKRISNMVKADREEAIELLTRKLILEQVQNIIQTNGSPQQIPRTVMDLLKSAACKGAYKFGDELSLQSCMELIENLKSCKAPFQCAHGRPVLVPLTNL